MHCYQKYMLYLYVCVHVSVYVVQQCIPKYLDMQVLYCINYRYNFLLSVVYMKAGLFLWRNTACT